MNIQNILTSPAQPWFQGKHPDSDVVLSSRVRLARNIANIQFPNMANESELMAVEMAANEAKQSLSEEYQEEMTYVKMSDLDRVDREILLEKHLVSPQLISVPAHRGIVINEAADITFMVNEEDHFRLQILAGGLQLESLWEKANRADDALESKINFAFTDKWGYLTACPTNVGTGMRASVMVHVPALVRTKKIKRIIQGILKFSYSVRGIYGEGSEMLGDILQISNQVTLGIREAEIVENLTNLTHQLVKEEMAAREELRRTQAVELRDEIWRAYGILRYARKLSGHEALTLLSTVELGRILGWLPHIPENLFREMMVTTRPGFLSRYANTATLNETDRDRWRAAVVRETLDNKVKE